VGLAVKVPVAVPVADGVGEAVKLDVGLAV
jgi:hypothetical protein